MNRMGVEWNPARSALVIVDVQNDYCHKDGSIAKQGLDVSMAEQMLPNLKQMIRTCKENNVPVIYIQTIHEDSTDSKTWVKRLKNKTQKDLCRKNTWGSEFFHLAPEDEDVIVIKHRYSAFINTRFDSVLRAMEIDTLLMAGVSTNICVESTARDGFMLDYDILLLSDCTGAFTREEYDMSLKTIDKFFGSVTSSAEIMESLKREVQV